MKEWSVSYESHRSVCETEYRLDSLGRSMANTKVAMYHAISMDGRRGGASSLDTPPCVAANRIVSVVLEGIAPSHFSLED